MFIIFYSLAPAIFSYLAVKILCVATLAANSGNFLMSKARLGLFYSTNIVLILVLNWIHSSVLELVADSRCKFWGLVYAK